ncbi:MULTISPECIES: hypothetical protein [Paenibacillus]|uniref:hypothetical protein n=1 Tax=Paenibacillus TaxID=44249 RepID=UPI002FE1372B
MLVLLLILVVGCTQISKEQSALKSYLEEKGYRVLSYEGRVDSYQLTKQKIVTLPHMIYWGLQTVDPSNYFGKTVYVEKFTVKNHPLAQGKVEVYVYVVDGKPFGGTSNPSGEELMGGYWSLEGKTLEEIQLKPFQEWQHDWLKTYSN